MVRMGKANACYARLKAVDQNSRNARWRRHKRTEHGASHFFFLWNTVLDIRRLILSLSVKVENFFLSSLKYLELSPKINSFGLDGFERLARCVSQQFFCRSTCSTVHTETSSSIQLHENAALGSLANSSLVLITFFRRERLGESQYPNI